MSGAVPVNKTDKVPALKASHSSWEIDHTHINKY